MYQNILITSIQHPCIKNEKLNTRFDLYTLHTSKNIEPLFNKQIQIK